MCSVGYAALCSTSVVILTKGPTLTDGLGLCNSNLHNNSKQLDKEIASVAYDKMILENLCSGCATLCSTSEFMLTNGPTLTDGLGLCNSNVHNNSKQLDKP